MKNNKRRKGRIAAAYIFCILSDICVFCANLFATTNNNHMYTRQKEHYEVPATIVLELSLKGAILDVSKPDNYPGGGDPFAG